MHLANYMIPDKPFIIRTKAGPEKRTIFNKKEPSVCSLSLENYLWTIMYTISPGEYNG